MIDFVCSAFALSIRKACRTIPTCRATYHYRCRRPARALRLPADNGVAAAWIGCKCDSRRHAGVYQAPRRPQQCDGTQPGLGDGLDADELFDGRKLWVLTSTPGAECVRCCPWSTETPKSLA